MPDTGGYLLETQEESEWCWAAVAQSVERFFDPNAELTQCQIANNVIVRRNCCGDPVPDSCNVPQRLTDALGNRGIDRLQKDGALSRPLSFGELQQQLDAHRPVCVRIEWDGGGGHAVVVTGYQLLSSGARLVDVADPLYPDCTVDYEELANAYQGDGRWTDSFLVKAVKGA
jgi:hypothetical protein